MAEGSSFDSYARDLNLSDVISLEGAQIIPGTQEFILGDNTDRLFRLAKEFGTLSTERNQAKCEKHGSSHQSNRAFSSKLASVDDHVNPIFFEVTRLNEYGLVELDMKKLERKRLNLVETAEVVPSEMENSVKILKDNVTNFLKKEEAKISSQQTEQKKSSSSEEKEKEKLTEFKYEKKNKLWDRKPHLKLMCVELSLCNEGKFIEEDLLNYFESEVHPAVDIFYRIAYPKSCEKDFFHEFPTGALAEEVELLESISISMDHFEFGHKALEEDFLKLFEGNTIDSVAKDLEKNLEINNLFPSFKNFLECPFKFQYPIECFTVILAILKNPYRKFEFILDSKLPVVKEQTFIADYLVNCFIQENILYDKVMSEKLAETVITFANMHSSFLAAIVAGFTELLNKQTNDKHTVHICSKVLNIMSSIGSTIILLCLPQHFENITCLIANDQNCELYINLLRACEILIADAIENESLIEEECFDVISFSSDCYNYFGRALTNRLVPLFRKYKERKDREERYLSKKHAIFPTKDGYMNIEMEFLKDREYKKSKESKREKDCTFDFASKILCSPTAQLYHKIQEMFGISEKYLK